MKKNYNHLWTEACSGSVVGELLGFVFVRKNEIIYDWQKEMINSYLYDFYNPVDKYDEAYNLFLKYKRSFLEYSVK